MNGDQREVLCRCEVPRNAATISFLLGAGWPQARVEAALAMLRAKGLVWCDPTFDEWTLTTAGEVAVKANGSWSFRVSNVVILERAGRCLFGKIEDGVLFAGDRFVACRNGEVVGLASIDSIEFVRRADGDRDTIVIRSEAADGVRPGDVLRGPDWPDPGSA